MSNDRSSKFAAALQQLETDRDVDGFVSALFSDEVELLRPETNQQVQGLEGAKTFWTQYLDQFGQISSRFDRVVEAGDVGVLEWTSSGEAVGGASITYRGVSLLDFDQDNRIWRFSTFFDTAQFA